MIKHRLRLLSHIVVAYMLIAFTWWSVLLFTKNKDAFQAKRELMRIGMIAEGLVENEEQFVQTPPYLDLKNEYQRQEWMIMGEAVVFIITLVIGIWLINRSFSREIEAAEQRRNFLLSITHELKSPIASIRLVLETLLKRQLRPDQVAKFGQSALKETDRLNTLVNDLLLSAKLETAYQLHLTKVDLVELFSEIVGRLREKYPHSKFEIYQEDHIPLIEGDEPGLTSVALNLIENAVKYSPKPAHITVRTYCENEFIVIEVADRGIGISEKDKKRIFDKFYRVGSEDTRKTKGTGLGLYIVQQLVKMHGGTISVKDNTPQGTIFKIKLKKEGIAGVSSPKKKSAIMS